MVSLWYYKFARNSFALVIIILIWILGWLNAHWGVGTIWTIFSVSGLPFPFYKMCVPSDLYLCYLQPLLSSPGWTPAKSALVSVAFFPLHCICLIVIRVYFIYRVFFPWTKKKLYIAIRVFPPLTYYLIPLLSSTCHHFHVPDVVGEWNRHHGNIYSDDAVF